MALLDPIFAPIMALNPTLSILIFSMLVSTVISICYKFLVDPLKAREIKGKVKDIQQRLTEAQKKNDTKAMNNLMSEAMQNNGNQMQIMMKPMLVSMLLVILILPSMNTHYAGVSMTMPITIPLVGNVVPFGWIGWYFISSIPFVILTRKLLGVEL
jgi:uncharacterized membrane protein (DUF106 family)